jgi:hypothetical protein
MRFGFARYFEKRAGVRFGHVICEVWDEQEKRWFLVDPDRNYIDFSPERFDFSYQAWINLRDNKIDEEVYVSSIGDGLKGVINLLTLDAVHTTTEERMHWIYPEIALREINSYKSLGEPEYQALDELAVYLEDPDRQFFLIDSLYNVNTSFHPADFNYEDYCKMMEERGKD